jgi:hypothetical protein
VRPTQIIIAIVFFFSSQQDLTGSVREEEEKEMDLCDNHWACHALTPTPPTT